MRTMAMALLGAGLALGGCVALPQDAIIAPAEDAQLPVTDAEAEPDARPDAEIPAPDAAAGPCTPSPEICDGVDNDCNGSTDDDVTDDEGGCRVGVGACRTDGEERCVRGVLVCNALPGDPSEERCDGEDNDCDGMTDEGDAGRGECVTGGLGVCAIGHVTCTAGALICVPDTEPEDEACDGLDGNCDGAIDNVADGVCCTGDDDAPLCNGCPNGTHVRDGWICVPSGTYLMGHDGDRLDETPAHEVIFTRPVLLMETEVTRAQWNDAFDNDPSTSENRPGACPSCPVDNVNWYEAAAYTNALSERDGLPECYTLGECDGSPGEGMACSARTQFVGIDCLGYRLPTEAEWEYAARAGTRSEFWSGDADADLIAVAWHAANSTVDDGLASHPVAELQANPWGLFDVHGNVWEWVHDWHGLYEDGPQRDPMGAAGPVSALSCDQVCEAFVDICDADELPADITLPVCITECATNPRVADCIEDIVIGPNICLVAAVDRCINEPYSRVFRGGSYRDQPEAARSAFRGYDRPEIREQNIGFRVLRRVP